MNKIRVRNKTRHACPVVRFVQRTYAMVYYRRHGQFRLWGGDATAGRLNHSFALCKCGQFIYNPHVNSLQECVFTYLAKRSLQKHQCRTSIRTVLLRFDTDWVRNDVSLQFQIFDEDWVQNHDGARILPVLSLHYSFFSPFLPAVLCFYVCGFVDLFPPV